MQIGPFAGVYCDYAQAIEANYFHPTPTWLTGGPAVGSVAVGCAWATLGTSLGDPGTFAWADPGELKQAPMGPSAVCTQFAEVGQLWAENKDCSQL